jgi:poly(3-hydroxybutyrate) depolymerase
MRTFFLLVLAAGVASLAACGSSSSGPPTMQPEVDAPTTTNPGTTTPKLPAATGTCPTIAPGDVTFAPAGMPARKVKLAFDPGSTTKGPLVLYWHATGSAPAEAAYALGATANAIVGAGGVIATPYSDPAAGTFEWFVVNGSPKLDDFVLADEIVACLASRIDAAHVHAMGMSAGALQTTALSFARASYVASVATYSGGMPDGFAPTNANPANKFAALIFMGGASDNVFGVDFKAASERYRATLAADGHFTALCDHGAGHEIPLDAAPSVAAFFAANGYGAWPSPYEGGLPSSFPTYCVR